MNIFDILDNNISGNTFISIDTETPVKLRGGKKNPLQGRVTKRVTGSNVIVFQNKKINGYEAMVNRRLVQEGFNPDSFKVGPRAWGTRIENTPFVRHGDNIYLEVIFLRHGTVEYLVDGVVEPNPFNIEGLFDFAHKDEGRQGGLMNKVIIRTYNVENITAITVNKQRYQLK